MTYLLFSSSLLRPHHQLYTQIRHRQVENFSSTLFETFCNQFCITKNPRISFPQNHLRKNLPQPKSSKNNFQKILWIHFLHIQVISIHLNRWTKDKGYEHPLWKDTGNQCAGLAGNIYVTGWVNRDDWGQDRNIWLRKYDTNGNVQWTETYDGAAHLHDIGLGVEVDTAGNVYVTGFVDDENELNVGGDIILQKYAQVLEPGTLLLLAPALLGLAGLLRRKRR